MRETWVRSLGQENPLEKEMATHPSILAWTEEPGRLQSTGLQRVGHNWATSLSLSVKAILNDNYSYDEYLTDFFKLEYSYFTVLC